ncbi:MAG: hypothetical protein ABFD84_00660 [Candidatus Polarisedimenticolia bacterium]|nr:hypothetical protein [bacterium]
MDKNRDRDRERGERPRPPERTDLGNDEQVKRLKRAMERSAAEVVRCQNCGHQTRAEAAFIGPLTNCDNCGKPLHSCRHCAFFETSARFQCEKPVPAPVGDKWAANDCALYEPRLVLDATGRRAESRPAVVARNAFDALFKR